MNIFEGNQPVMLLFIAAVALTSWILLRRSYRYYARQKKDQGPIESPKISSNVETWGQNPAAPREETQWEVRMHDTARDLSARLDSKMSALLALIAEADRAAARLEAAVGQTAGADRAKNVGALRGGNRTEEIKILSAYGFSAADIANRVGCEVEEVESVLSVAPNKR
jgi:hypothetical protein